MPTYTFQCKSCGEEKEEFSFSFPPKEPSCLCGSLMTRTIGGGGTIWFQGDDWPTKQFTRDREDKYIHSAASRARKLKSSGKVRMEDVLSFKDVDKLSPI
jgi:putative FmdB family regulatory protein